MGTSLGYIQSRAFILTRPILVSYLERFVIRFSHQAIMLRHLKHVATICSTLKLVTQTGMFHHLVIPTLKTTRGNGKMFL